MYHRSSWVDGPQRQETPSGGGGELLPLMSRLLCWAHLDDDDDVVVEVMVVWVVVKVMSVMMMMMMMICR